MTARRYRHRVDIAATLSLDIVTECSAVTAAQVEALLAAHLNFDEGNALDYGVLDGHMARLYLPLDPNTGEWTKEFEPADVMDANDDDPPDVVACTRCPGEDCETCAGLGFYHDGSQCP
jgi:hypothetical protein